MAAAVLQGRWNEAPGIVVPVAHRSLMAKTVSLKVYECDAIPS